MHTPAYATVQKHTLRDNYDTYLRIEALCDASGMSRASLHRHFLTITCLSPLQYRKQLRLQEARQLLLASDHRASDVAFAVGYESASQLSREYLRQCGALLVRDVVRSGRRSAVRQWTERARRTYPAHIAAKSSHGLLSRTMSSALAANFWYWEPLIFKAADQ
jgi:AraC-like DNA-binding protein